VPVPDCITALARDIAPALTQCISKEEKDSYRNETSLDAQIPLYETHIIDIAEIYMVVTESGKSLLEESDPFIHCVALEGPKGEIVWLRGVFDDGVTINAINSKAFTTVKHRLSEPKKSNHILHMANGLLIPSYGTWIGTIQVGGTSMEGAFEIFLSGDSWALLFGKPLLKTFDMTHQYKSDTISLEGPSGKVTLTNQFGQTLDSGSAAAAGVSLMADIKQSEAFRRNSHSPLRQVLPQNPATTSEQSDESLHTLTDTAATVQRNRTTTTPRTLQETDETETTMALPSSCETALGDNLSPVREVSPVTSSDSEIHHINTTTADPTNHQNY
jgi:hypothetical protein